MKTFIALLTAAAGTAVTSHAETINIAFHNGDATVDGFDTRPDGTVVSAGTNGSDTWNNIREDVQGEDFTGFSLALSDGTSSGATLASDAGFVTFNQNGWRENTDDHVMMESWYGYSDAEAVSVFDLGAEFTSLGYNVTIYGDIAGNRDMDYVLDGVTKTIDDTSDFSGSFVEGANFVTFTGLTDASFSITGNTTKTGRSAINGIIISAIPEPGSLALLGLGGLLVVSRRRLA